MMAIKHINRWLTFQTTVDRKSNNNRQIIKSKQKQKETNFGKGKLLIKYQWQKMLRKDMGDRVRRDYNIDRASNDVGR